MNKIIVTSGQKFTDIDALACVASYAELLKLEGKDAEAVLPGILNESITSTVRAWGLNFSTKHHPQVTNNDSYVLMDISDEKEFAIFVNLDNILEIFDHRYGYENYWKEKMANNSHIEMVGSCATLIWEEFEKRINPLKISATSANLLLTAVVSNTLNFKASVTTERDIKAFENLKNFSSLPNNWSEKYFEEQDSEKLNNVYNAIINDTKIMDGPVIGQLEMWSSKELFDKHLENIQKAMESFGKPEWFLTSPSISEGINYIFAKNKDIKKLLEKAIDTKFNGDIGTTNKLWLRKEIAKKIRDLV